MHVVRAADDVALGSGGGGAARPVLAHLAHTLPRRPRGQPPRPHDEAGTVLGRQGAVPPVRTADAALTLTDVLEKMRRSVVTHHWDRGNRCRQDTALLHSFSSSSSRVGVGVDEFRGRQK